MAHTVTNIPADSEDIQDSPEFWLGYLGGVVASLIRSDETIFGDLIRPDLREFAERFGHEILLEVLGPSDSDPVAVAS